MALDYLTAGAHYHWAYRAAFEHERAEFVHRLRVPTTIFSWQQSIVYPYIQQLTQHPMPNSVRIVHISGTGENRYDTICAAVRTTYTERASYKLHTTAFHRPFPSQKAISPLPPPIPDAAGCYLVKAWFELRDLELQRADDQLVKPRYDPDYLQTQLLNWMRTLCS